MAEQQLNLQPLAALQDLVGRNNMMSELKDKNKSSLIGKSSLEIPNLPNSSSITITRTSQIVEPKSKHINEELTEICENETDTLLLGGGACTITRISSKDSQAHHRLKTGEDQTNNMCDTTSENAPHSVLLPRENDSTNMNTHTFSSMKNNTRLLNRSGSLDSDSSNNEKLETSRGNNMPTAPSKELRPRSMSLEVGKPFSKDISCTGSAGSFSICKLMETSIESNVKKDQPISNGVDLKNLSAKELEDSTSVYCNDTSEGMNSETFLNDESSCTNFLSENLGIKGNDDHERTLGLVDAKIKNDSGCKDKKELSVQEEVKTGENSTLLPKLNSTGIEKAEHNEEMIEVDLNDESLESVEAKFDWDAVKCVSCDVICMTEENPKLLPCLHSMCGKCLLKEATKRSSVKEDADIVEMYPYIQCQVCRKPFQNNAIIDNIFVSETMSSKKENSTDQHFICTSCSDEENASGFCADCEEWLCDTCIQAHKRVKVTKDHIIKNKDDVSLESGSTKTNLNKKLHLCQNHPKEALNLYCLTCDQLTCRDCQLREHREHKYKFASEMASQMKDKLRKLVKDIQKKRVYIDSAKNLVVKRRDQLSKRKESVEADIKRLVETYITNFTDIIKQRGKVLNDQLLDICNVKDEQLDKKTDVLNHLGTQADYCVSVVEKVLDSASEMALLFSKKTLLDHVMKVDKDSPDGALFDRFKTKLNSGDEISLRISSESRGLGKALKDVGYLLVDNRSYPPSTQEPNSSASKTRSAQPSPVSDSSSPHPPAQPVAPTVSLPPPPVTVSTQAKLSLPPEPIPSLHVAPMPQQQPNPITPQPPTLTPMHNHHQQQQLLQGSSGYHPKFHNYNQCGGVNPPGLVRIQPKPGGMVHNGLVPPSSMGAPIMSHGMSQFPRMPPHMNAQNCRPGDMSNVSSSTHPLGESSHLRGLLGSGGTYKLGAYPPMMRMPQHQPSAQQYAQHNASAAQQLHHQQQRIMEQNRLVFPLNQQLAMAAVAMAPPLLGARSPQMNQTRPLQQLNNVMRNPLTQSHNGNMPKEPPRQQPSHNPQQNHQAKLVEAQSWHIPHTPSMSVEPASIATPSLTSSLAADNSFKIMLGSKSVSVTPVSMSTSNGDCTDKKPPTMSPAPFKAIVTPYRTILPKDSRDPPTETAAEGTHDTKMTTDLCSKELAPSNLLDSCSSPCTDPVVDSSKTSPTKRDSSDPNDDWCAVCWDGGDLICCDFCPKVFHMNCHIPSLPHLPRVNEKWQCMICRDFSQLPEDPLEACVPGSKRKSLRVTSKELKIAQRILLELYCNYEASQPFRELVDRELTEYYEVIQHPMALEIIKKKLKPDSIDHYTDLDQFAKDINLIFKNCYEFNPAETEIYQNAKILQDFFEKLVTKWLPGYEFGQCDDPGVASPDAKRSRNEHPVHIS